MTWHTQCKPWRMGVREQQPGEVLQSLFPLPPSEDRDLLSGLENSWKQWSHRTSDTPAPTEENGAIGTLYWHTRFASGCGSCLLPWDRGPGRRHSTFPAHSRRKHVSSAVAIPVSVISLESGMTKYLGYTNHPGWDGRMEESQYLMACVYQTYQPPPLPQTWVGNEVLWGLVLAFSFFISLI